MNGVSLGKTIAISALAAVLTLLGLVYGLNMEPIDAFYISFTIGSATAAAVALSQREANLGVVASAAALLILLAVAGPYLGLQSILVFRTQTTVVEIPAEMIPWIMVGFVAIFAVGYAMGASVGRLALWCLGSMLSMFWFAVTDVASQVILACIVAVIAAVPLLKQEPRARYTGLLAAAILPAARTEITFDFTQINYFGMLFTPVVLFVALDPFDVIRNRLAREIASVIVLFLVFLQVLSAVL
mgnify:CR=1 FL=1